MANIKVYSSAKETLTLATQLFLGKSEEEISSRVKDTLEALQRSTIAQLTGDEEKKDYSYCVVVRDAEAEAEAGGSGSLSMEAEAEAEVEAKAQF